MEPPSTHPPPFQYGPPPQQNDEEHLKLISLFHYIYGGFAFLGVAFLGVHFFFMRMIFTRPEMVDSSGNRPPPEIFTFIVVFYVIMALICVALAVANILSGIFIRQRKHRLFSLILAGFNCLQMPFGTALGVFTFVVLGRPMCGISTGNGWSETERGWTRSPMRWHRSSSRGWRWGNRLGCRSSDWWRSGWPERCRIW